MAAEQRPSALLLDEYFASQDARFVEHLRVVNEPKKLAGLADRWKKDPRPWARQQVFAYLDFPFSSAGHEPVIKRLFKQAEGDHDDEAIAAFVVALDRAVRREVRKKHRWDRQARQSYTEEVLYSPRNVMPRSEDRQFTNPRTGRVVTWRPPTPRNAKLFSYATRYYLRRRAWRYFRRMGFQKPEAYPLAVARALALYRDADLATGANILDSWSLMQACFRMHPALKFGRAVVKLADGHGLNELSAAPRFPELWKKPESGKVLVGLLMAARSRLVRVWAIQLLRRDHPGALGNISAEELIRLLDHDDQETQQYAAEALATITGVDGWAVETWMRLMQTRNPAALQRVCDAMAKHVAADRLDMAQCIALACARPVPIARMGLVLLKGKPVLEKGAGLAALSAAQCEAVAGEIAAWALSILGTPQSYDTESISAFFDSLSQPMREAAWAWLTPQSAGHNDPALWSRLLESPYEDVRLRLVDQLAARAALPGGGRHDLTPLWTCVLLGIHRGGRQKLKALRQISEAIRDDPARGAVLLPVLAVALRSVRPAEARAALAAVVAAVEARPALMDAVRIYLPELQINPQEATR